MGYEDTPFCDRGVHLIAELPERERPRERMLSQGADALSDTELVALVLRNGLHGRSVLSLARDVMEAFRGDLGHLAKATIGELRGIRGIGIAKAVELCAAFTLAKRLAAQRTPERCKVGAPAEVLGLFKEHFRGLMQEEFHALLLNTKHYLMRDECITLGLVDRSQVHAREVFRTAIREGCSRIVLVHNHPSGDPTPSPQDIICTQQLVEAGKIIGIAVIDHVIIARPGVRQGRQYLSFREEGLLSVDGHPASSSDVGGSNVGELSRAWDTRPLSRLDRARGPELPPSQGHGATSRRRRHRSSSTICPRAKCLEDRRPRCSAGPAPTTVLDSATLGAARGQP